MRNANALSILNYLRTNGVSTRREIQAATGLSWATVSTITADLIAQDILIEKAPKERVFGRTPTLLDFNPRKNMSIGAEINVEGLTVVLLDLRGRVISAQEELLDQAEKHSTTGVNDYFTDAQALQEICEKEGVLCLTIPEVGHRLEHPTDFNRNYEILKMVTDLI